MFSFLFLRQNHWFIINGKTVNHHDFSYPRWNFVDVVFLSATEYVATHCTMTVFPFGLHSSQVWKQNFVCDFISLIIINSRTRRVNAFIHSFPQTHEHRARVTRERVSYCPLIPCRRFHASLPQPFGSMRRESVCISLHHHQFAIID